MSGNSVKKLIAILLLTLLTGCAGHAKLSNVDYYSCVLIDANQCVPELGFKWNMLMVLTDSTIWVLERAAEGLERLEPGYNQYVQKTLESAVIKKP